MADSPHRIRKPLVGETFGRLTVLEELGWIGQHRTVRCACSCGTEVITRASAVTTGHARSCGCLARETNSARERTHGMTGTPEYRAFNNMHSRCEAPSTRNFANYGGRGIRVCERWQDFANFLADMGPRPSPAHTLDRIDSDGNYEPGNCRWATMREQQRNKRTNLPLTHGGRTLLLCQWAEELGIAKDTIRDRLRRGWSLERALFTPCGDH